jgi:hypothetical protein
MPAPDEVTTRKRTASAAMVIFCVMEIERMANPQ